MYKKTLLVNAQGNEFYGWSENDLLPTTGELIFNTAMSGFVEILSDPSYINQIVSFTSAHVGNYGLSSEDFESSSPKIAAAIGNSFTTTPSSWRNEKSLTDWLKEYLKNLVIRLQNQIKYLGLQQNQFLQLNLHIGILLLKIEKY